MTQRTYIESPIRAMVPRELGGRQRVKHGYPLPALGEFQKIPLSKPCKQRAEWNF
jgi:hypothetical protein